MNGIWDSLTLQGKLVLLAVVGVAILIFAMVYRGGSADGDSPPAAVIKTPTSVAQRTPTAGAAGVVATATRTTTASNGSTPTAGEPTATSVAAATATTAPSSPTPEIVEAPTATAVIEAPPPPPEPTATLAPPPPAASPTPSATIAAVNCVVLATVSNTAPFVGDTETVTGQLSCGKPIAGSTMRALFSFSNNIGTCSGTSDGEGRASCSVRLLEVPPNVFVSVSVCFTYEGEIVCGKTGFTPQ